MVGALESMLDEELGYSRSQEEVGITDNCRKEINKSKINSDEVKDEYLILLY